MSYSNKFGIIDAHNDLLSYIYLRRRQGFTNILANEFLEDFQKSNVKVIVCSIFIESEFIPEMALRQALDQISVLHEDLKSVSDKIELCTTYEQLNRVTSAGKIAFLLSLEGVEPLYNDILLLKIFYELGVRILGLTWSRRNYAADGALFSNTRNIVESGLTDFGHEVVRKAQELGMILDVSHLSPNAFWEIVNNYTLPIIASHSNTRKLCNIKRNLDDEQIKVIAARNGIIGINGANVIASQDGANATVKDMVAHMKHIKAWVGVEHIGLGLDMCTKMLHAQGSSTFEINNQKMVFYDIIPDYQSLPGLVDEMRLNDFDDAEINMILYNNFERFFKLYL